MSEKKCPACGASIDLNATECRYCGEAITAQAPQYQTQPTNTYSENVDSEYKYLKPYYQEEFKKINDSNKTYNGKWNWPAFFFSWIWGLTKGLWVAALINIGLTIVLSYLKITWASLAISIFWGLRGNYLYHNLVVNKKQLPSK